VAPLSRGLKGLPLGVGLEYRPAADIGQGKTEHRHWIFDKKNVSGQPKLGGGGQFALEAKIFFKKNEKNLLQQLFFILR
jgi:hypothetical protein